MFERSERESSIAKVNPTGPAPWIFWRMTPEATFVLSRWSLCRNKKAPNDAGGFLSSKVRDQHFATGSSPRCVTKIDVNLFGFDAPVWLICFTLDVGSSCHADFQFINLNLVEATSRFSHFQSIAASAFVLLGHAGVGQGPRCGRPRPVQRRMS